MNAYKQCSLRLLHICIIAFLLLAGSAANDKVALGKDDPRYQNPLPLRTADGKSAESCADPALARGSLPGDNNAWYLYCTTDPLRGDDRDAVGSLIFHLIPIYKSTDLVNWTYQGDVFAARPSWVAADAGLWAPDIEFFNGKYYLYFTASNTSLPGEGSAIGVATSDSPTGPWTDSGSPAVEPHEPPCCPNDRRWVFDPAIVTDEATGQRYIFYGSYFGGISARTLSADGLHSDPASQVQITIANRYEGTYIRKHGGYYYLFASATNCCNGPLTGYSVFAGRSQYLLGPYVDREGVSLLAGRVGGTPVLSMNGNRWVGPGHNAIVTDLAGQDWFVYHAVDRNDPFFAGEVGFTKRPVLLDRLDWIDGWPTVRAERWASDTPQPAPVTQPGDQGGNSPNNGVIAPATPKDPKPLAQFSDEFNMTTLSSQWHWVRQPAAGTYSLADGTFRFDTQAADLYVDSNNASVLLEAAPKQDYVVEARVKLNVPTEGCCQNYVQAGLVIYGDDDNFIKLAHASIWETRQTEFAKELSPVPANYPRYGNTVVGAPDEWTYLRIVRHADDKTEHYTAYTSRNGSTWVHGGTWTHHLGNQAKIGLVSMGGAGFTANFDYVRVYRVGD